MADQPTTVLWVSQPNLGRDVPAASWPIVRVTQTNGSAPTVTTTTDADAALDG